MYIFNNVRTFAAENISNTNENETDSYDYGSDASQLLLFGQRGNG